MVEQKVFQRNSDFEISGLAISEKNSDVKTVVYSLSKFWFVRFRLQPPIQSAAFRRGAPASTRLELTAPQYSVSQ